MSDGRRHPHPPHTLLSLEGRRSLQLQAVVRGMVYSKRDDKKIRKTFRDLAEAKGWRADADSAVRKRALRSPSKVTIAQAAEEWLEGARSGKILTVSGDRYKPSAVRGYERTVNLSWCLTWAQRGSQTSLTSIYRSSSTGSSRRALPPARSTTR